MPTSSMLKDYKSLISERLPYYKVYRSTSDVRNNQLGKHFNTLKEYGLLSEWRIQKNSRGNGFTLYFYPGDAFFEDFNHIQRSRNSRFRMVINGDEEARKKPHEAPKALP